MTAFQRKRSSFMEEIRSPIAGSADFSIFLKAEELLSLDHEEFDKRIKTFSLSELEDINIILEEIAKEKETLLKKLKGQV